MYLVGASGGVYALLAAHLANVLLNYNQIELGFVRLVGVFVVGKCCNKKGLTKQNSNQIVFLNQQYP